MPDRAQIWRQLALADRHIAETRRRIEFQDEIVRRLAPSGDEIHAALARTFLVTLHHTLAVMNYHHRLIVEELEEAK